MIYACTIDNRLLSIWIGAIGNHKNVLNNAFHRVGEIALICY